MSGASVAHSLREAACLAHTVPGVTLRLHCRSGAELLVSYSCLGADLDPCRLRATLAHERTSGVARLTDAIERVELVAGLRPLGAGLFERGAGDAGERWFVTALSVTDITDALAGGPDQFHTVVKPDAELGVHGVCVRALPDAVAAGVPGALDEAAVWALAAVCTAEVAAELHAIPRRSPPSRPDPSPPSRPDPSPPSRADHCPPSRPDRSPTTPPHSHRKDHP